MFQALSSEEKKEWQEKILQQQQSGKSASRWCRENGERYNAFLYWKKQLFPETIIKRSSFTEIIDEPKGTGVTLEYQGFCLSLEKQFDSSVLKQCLAALKETIC